MVKWGILGLGRAANSFAKAISELENSKLIATASLSKIENVNLLKKFDIKKNFFFNSYDELINCKEIYAIYIATLNDQHAKLILKCARANKAILCEKPMSLSIVETKKIFDYLYQSKVFFLENIAYRSHPQTSEIMNQILNNEIGKIIKIESSYGFKVNQILKFKPSHRLFNSKFGGGAINDIGCYPISFAVLIARLLKNENKETSYEIINASSKKNFRGTDDEGHLKVKFDNLFTAEFEVSIKKKISRPTIIHGSLGKIVISNPWLPNKDETIELVKNGNNFSKKISSKYSIYANTIKAASDAIKMKKESCEFPNMTWEDSLINSKILSEWKSFTHKN